MDFNYVNEQHSLFTSSNRIQQILLFLVGKNSSKQAVQLEKKLEKEFDDKYVKIVLKDEILKKVTDFEKQEVLRQQQHAKGQ